MDSLLLSGPYVLQELFISPKCKCYYLCLGRSFWDGNCCGSKDLQLVRTDFLPLLDSWSVVLFCVFLLFCHFEVPWNFEVVLYLSWIYTDSTEELICWEECQRYFWPHLTIASCEMPPRVTPGDDHLVKLVTAMLLHSELTVFLLILGNLSLRPV